jgi:Transposase DDE domain
MAKRSGRRRRERGLFGQAIVEADGQELVRVSRLALRVARKHLSDYPHVNAPKKFTQPQLFVCLILKAITGATYRRTEEMLILMPAVRECLGLRDVPRFTTLQAFADRPDVLALVDGVLRTLGHAAMKHERQDAALDGTGVETTSASAHFISRAGRKRTKFVKLMIAVLCASVMPAALEVGWGPTHDMREAWSVREKLLEACGERPPTMLWGDGAFDCEAWHKSNWEETATPSYAPVTIKSKDGSVGGFYRKAFSEMKPHEYGRRWMCESVNSAIKRVTGDRLRSRKQNTLFAEAALKVAAYAVKV